MAQDITEQASQEELADALVADPEPQPQESATEDAEPEESAEQIEQPESEEDAEDYLPQEDAKVFPDEEVNRYAEKRYSELVKAINDPRIAEPTRQQLKQLLHDKLNTDLFLRSLQQREQEEPEEELEPEPEPEPTQPVQQVPQLSFDQHIQQIQQAVKQNTSPEMANWMFNNFMEAFGVDKATIQSLAPQQAAKFVETLSVGALNLINTFAPQLFGTYMPQMMEQQFPEFGGMYQRSATASNWDSVRSEFLDAELPAYGTREYSTAARKIGAEIAGSAERFENMVFTGRNGQPLSAAENRAEKLRMIAERMIQGSQEQLPPPAVVAQAVQTGQKIAQRQAAQQSAGNLGAGKSRTQTARKGDDDFWADGVAEYQKQHGSL